MACTTILVGKNASYDGSTIVARNEDSPSGEFCAKRFAVMKAKDQPRKYKSVISKVEIDLPDDPMDYTYSPSSDTKDGIWGAYGVNAANVTMNATETLTTNELVMGADPLVEYHKDEDGTEHFGGIGEEDLVTITLPYIKSAKDGVRRLGALLEKYGTYEMNGIAFQDENEIWWLETIGGHNWMAKRVPDEAYVIMPNQLGIDEFDFDDAYGKKKEYMCSKSLKDLVKKAHLDKRMFKDEEVFNPREAFGSHDDSDHTYNTPRAWVLLRYFNPNTFNYEGNTEPVLKPTDDILPWAMIPEKKITIQEVKWALSNHYQGTPYDPYAKHKDEMKAGIFRPIGINRNNVLGLTQVRGYMPDDLKALHWLALGSNVFNAIVPFYTRVSKTPDYVGKAVTKPSTDNFYWINRIIGALADAHFAENASNVERYQAKINNKMNEYINRFDDEYAKAKDKEAFFEKANQEISDFVEKETLDYLDKVLYTSSCLMRNGFSRSDA